VGKYQKEKKNQLREYNGLPRNPPAMSVREEPLRFRRKVDPYATHNQSCTNDEGAPPERNLQWGSSCVEHARQQENKRHQASHQQ
jgi:hypothetical protein